MKIKTAQFVTSVADPAKLVAHSAPEIALCGKSNVGKSSFINMICGQNRLAKVGKEPGMTRLVNYFSLNNGQLMLVDLPGYGYANVSAAEKRKWGTLIEGYLQGSPNLKSVFLLIDVRRDPNEDDILMVNYLYHYAISFTVLATKTDKVSKQECTKRLKSIANALKITPSAILPVSALKGTGKEAIEQRFGEILEATKLAQEDDETDE